MHDRNAALTASDAHRALGLFALAQLQQATDVRLRTAIFKFEHLDLKLIRRENKPTAGAKAPAPTDQGIDRGQTLGTTGRVLIGIPGTYFEMRVDGKPVDPLEWLKKRT